MIYKGLKLLVAVSVLPGLAYLAVMTWIQRALGRAWEAPLTSMTFEEFIAGLDD